MTIEEQITQLEELAARYRNNATLPNIQGTSIAQGQITQALAFESQIESLKNQLLNPIKAPDESTIIPNENKQNNIPPLLIIGGLILGAVILTK